MSLTRALCKGMGLTDEQTTGVIEAHADTVNALKDEIARYKADAEKLPGVQEELEKAKEAAKNSGDAEKIQKAFDDYKAQVEAEKSAAAKKAAYEKVAKDAGLTEAGVAKAVKYADWNSVELDDKGNVKDAKALIKALKEEWPEHISKTTTTGANTPTPPGSGGDGKLTREEIFKKDEHGKYVLSTSERQKALTEMMNNA